MSNQQDVNASTLFEAEEQANAEALEQALRSAGYEGSVEEMIAAHQARLGAQEQEEAQRQEGLARAESTIRKLYGANSKKAEQAIEQMRKGAEEVRQHYKEKAEQEKALQAQLPSEPQPSLFWEKWKKDNPQLAQRPEVKARIKEDKKALGPLYHNKSVHAQRRLKGSDDS